MVRQTENDKRVWILEWNSRWVSVADYHVRHGSPPLVHQNSLWWNLWSGPWKTRASRDVGLISNMINDLFFSCVSWFQLHCYWNSFTEGHDRSQAPWLPAITSRPKLTNKQPIYRWSSKTIVSPLRQGPRRCKNGQPNESWALSWRTRLPQSHQTGSKCLASTLHLCLGLLSGYSGLLDG